MPIMRPPDDAYRFFVTRLTKGLPLMGVDYVSREDGHTYAVDEAHWICRRSDGHLERTIDPLPLGRVRRSEILTGLRWGFQLRLSEHIPLQQTLHNLREHVPPAKILEELTCAEESVERVPTWSDGMVTVTRCRSRRSGMEYAATPEGLIYVRVPETEGKYVRTRGRLSMVANGQQSSGAVDALVRPGSPRPQK